MQYSFKFFLRLLQQRLKQKNKITIITVVYNNELQIEDTIKSVITQNRRDFEYIIIDGKSNDRTLEIVLKYKKYIDIIISEKDINLYDAINKGIKNSSCDYIYLLHSGDTLHNKNVIDKYLNFISKYPKIDLFFNDMKIRHKGKFLILKPKIKLLWKNMLLNHPTWLIKKEIFNKYGLYDIKFPIAGDYDFALRVFHRINYKYLNFISTVFSLDGVSYFNEKAIWDSYRVRLKNKQNIILNYMILIYEVFLFKILLIKNKFISF